MFWIKNEYPPQQRHANHFPTIIYTSQNFNCYIVPSMAKPTHTCKVHNMAQSELFEFDNKSNSH
ncbi:hypothetical protein Syun_011757 [Stephania yunnanensis]|uniref:Uncharacterized protein n=1 Tax=Stephania yunnanensis TaxID=152371 RepID=A0AAP0PFR7_9MAGN